MRALRDSVFAVVSMFAVVNVGALAYSLPTAHAATLHGCVSDNCTENAWGVVSIATPSLPNFEFTSSPGWAKGTLFIDILVPDNVAGGNALDFSIAGGKTSPAAASLFEPTPWTRGDLANYLNISAKPANPIGLYDSESGRAPAVNGFYVYQADLGLNTLAGTFAPGRSPQLSLDGQLPEFSYVLAFLETTGSKHGRPTISYGATANSGAIFNDVPPVPLPASLPLFATGLGALALFAWRRRRNGRRSLPAAA